MVQVVEAVVQHEPESVAVGYLEVPKVGSKVERQQVAGTNRQGEFHLVTCVCVVGVRECREARSR